MAGVRWVVAFWRGNPPLAWFRSESIAWQDVPAGDGARTGVLFVDVWHEGYHHRLSGFDHYWVHGLEFGLFNDPSNWAWYGGGPDAQYLAWRWTQNGSERVRPATIPDAAHVLSGVTVPDEVAWEHGLLPRGARLPPRPAGDT